MRLFKYEGKFIHEEVKVSLDMRGEISTISYVNSLNILGANTMIAIRKLINLYGRKSVY